MVVPGGNLIPCVLDTVVPGGARFAWVSDTVVPGGTRILLVHNRWYPAPRLGLIIIIAVGVAGTTTTERREDSA